MGYYLKSDAVSLNTLADVFTRHLKARGVSLNKTTVISALLPAMKELTAEGVLTPVQKDEGQLPGPEVVPMSLTDELRRLAARGANYTVTVSRNAEAAPGPFQKKMPARTEAEIPLEQFINHVPNVEAAMKAQFGKGAYSLIITDQQQEFVTRFAVIIE